LVLRVVETQGEEVSVPDRGGGCHVVFPANPYAELSHRSPASAEG